MLQHHVNERAKIETVSPEALLVTCDLISLRQRFFFFITLYDT